VVDLTPARRRGLRGVVQGRDDLLAAFHRDGVDPGPANPGGSPQPGKAAVMHGGLQHATVRIQQHHQIAGGFHQANGGLGVKITDEQVVRHQGLTG